MLSVRGLCLMSELYWNQPLLLMLLLEGLRATVWNLCCGAAAKADSVGSDRRCGTWESQGSLIKEEYAVGVNTEIAL